MYVIYLEGRFMCDRSLMSPSIKLPVQNVVVGSDIETVVNGNRE